MLTVKSSLMCLFGLLVLKGVSAAVVHVPYDFKTIQAGIDAAKHGDTVLVHPGTYIETIKLKGKRIKLGSRFLNSRNPDWIDETIIKADSAGSVVYFLDYEDTNTVLSGFTITNGHPDWYLSQNFGGGIYCGKNTSPRLEYLKVIKNVAIHGGGIYCYANSKPVLTNVTVCENYARVGGGIYLEYNTAPYLENVNVYQNYAIDAGGGIYCYTDARPFLKKSAIYNNHAALNGGGLFFYCCQPRLINLTIFGNTATRGGGIFCGFASHAVIINSIIWQNEPQQIHFSVPWGGESSMAIAYSDVQGGATQIEKNRDTVYWLEGNLDADPLFLDAPNQDFELTRQSPAINAGTAYFQWEGAVLVELDATEYIGKAPDLGACEFPYVLTLIEPSKFPHQFMLYPNFPNPFNPVTTFIFQLPHFSAVRLTITNLLGEMVTTLINKEMPAGQHQVQWWAEAMSAGIYFYQLSAGKFSATGKCLLLK